MGRYLFSLFVLVVGVFLMGSILLGAQNNPPGLVLYQIQTGLKLLPLIVIRGIRTQVAVNHVDNLFDRFLV